jgi:hypothetical protein
VSKQSIAREIVLDGQANEIRINGVVFPFHILPAPEVELIGSDPGMASLGALHVGILADNITVIGESGNVQRVVQASAEAELAWARARAEEIVIDGLADVLRWIKKGMPE